MTNILTNVTNQVGQHGNNYNAVDVFFHLAPIVGAIVGVALGFILGRLTAKHDRGIAACSRCREAFSELKRLANGGSVSTAIIKEHIRAQSPAVDELRIRLPKRKLPGFDAAWEEYQKCCNPTLAQAHSASGVFTKEQCEQLATAIKNILRYANKK